MSEDFPDPPNDPIGEGEEDSRFFVDMRDQPPPANPPLTNPLFAEILPPTESTADKRWDPSLGEAMGFPLMKACIMDDINGEDDFTTQIGRIYWRKERELNMSDDEGSSSGEGCDPCKGLDKYMGEDCYAFKETEVDPAAGHHEHPEL